MRSAFVLHRVELTPGRDGAHARTRPITARVDIRVWISSNRKDRFAVHVMPALSSEFSSVSRQLRSKLTFFIQPSDAHRQRDQQRLLLLPLLPPPLPSPSSLSLSPSPPPARAQPSTPQNIFSPVMPTTAIQPMPAKVMSPDDSSGHCDDPVHAHSRQHWQVPKQC